MQVQFLSMAKIHSPDTNVPLYLQDRMSGIVWDDWAGDSYIFVKCKVITCIYVVGVGSSTPKIESPPQDRIVYYFRFARSSSKSSSESPEGEAFQFTGLIVDNKGEWLAKNFQNSDLDRVKQAVLGHGQDAPTLLGLSRITLRNPLNFN